MLHGGKGARELISFPLSKRERREDTWTSQPCDCPDDGELVEGPFCLTSTGPRYLELRLLPATGRLGPRDPGAPTSVLPPEFNPPILFQCLGVMWGDLGKQNCQNTWKNPILKKSFLLKQRAMNCGVRVPLFSAAAAFWFPLGAFTGLFLCI